MITLREAAQQALEALKNNAGEMRVEGAISILETALAQQAEPVEPVAWVKEDVCDGQYIDGRPRKIWWECNKGVGTAFYTTPPQRPAEPQERVQEPVAWIDALKEAFFDGFLSVATYNDTLLNSPEEAWEKYKPPHPTPAQAADGGGD